MYKSSFINCTLDSTLMENVDLLIRKYQIDYTPMCCAISRDNKAIVLGCGNFLVIINVQAGKQIKRIQAHGDLIKNVKFSKDGKQLISIAEDKTLRTWDTQSFKSVVIKLPQKGGPVYFSNQSQTIATVINKKQLKIWNMRSMASQLILSGHQQQLTSVCFSYNGELILTGSKDKSIRLWTVKGKLLHLYNKSHEKQIICCRITPSNAYIVSSSKDHSLIMHNTVTQQIINKRQFPQNEITQICLDLRQKFICVTFSNQSCINILDFNTLQSLHKLQGHQQRILSIAYDHTFTKLLSLSKDRTVRLWQLGEIMEKQMSRKQINDNQQIPHGSILAITYCKKLNYYATSHQNGQINIWDDKTNFIIHKLKDNTNNNNIVKKLQYDSLGNLYSAGKDGALRIWNNTTQHIKQFLISKPFKKIQVFSVEVLEMKINEKNNMLVMSSLNNQLVVYDLASMNVLMSTRDEGRVLTVAFDQQSKYMAIGGMDKVITTFTIQNNNISRLNQLGQHPLPITQLAYQGQSLIISSLQNGHIYIWNYIKQSLIKKIQNTSIIKHLSIFNSKYACLASQDGKIRVIDFNQGKQVKVFRYKSSCVGFVTKQKGENNQKQQNSTLSKIKNVNQNLPLLYAIYGDGNIIKWNLTQLSSTNNNNNKSNNNVSKQIMNNSNRKALRFGRKAVSDDGSIMVQLQGDRKIRILRLNQGLEELLQLKNCPQPIKGVQIIITQQNSQQQQDKLDRNKHNNILQSIILLLKSGKYYSPHTHSIISSASHANNNNTITQLLTEYNSLIIGDLICIKDKQQLYYKSGMKKLSKQIKKPTYSIINQSIIGN